MDEFKKNEIDEEALDEVSGGIARGGIGKEGWKFKFQYQKVPGKYETFVSANKYENKGKALLAGIIERNKYLTKNPSKVVVFETKEEAKRSVRSVTPI